MKSCIPIPLNISRILGTTVLMFILIGLLQGVYNYDDMNRREAKHLENIQYVRELQWQLIESSITDNYNNAELFAIGIKVNIETKVSESYPDSSKLQYDLDNPTSDAFVYNIFTESIKGKYLNNITNDNNDPFIASRHGVLSDLSLNCSAGDSVIRSWEKEIGMHANKTLANKAVQAITLQNNKPIFWEYSQSSNTNHIIVTEMDIRELHRVFMVEGLEGLQTYEFLKPVYIQQYTDILGVPDVNNLGVKQQNNKVVIVAGFNIYDILMKYHKSSMDKYDVRVDILKRDHSEANSHAKVINAFICIILLFCIVVTVIINNYAVSLIQRDNTRTESTKPDIDTGTE